jgi:hypothetical protein
VTPLIQNTSFVEIIGPILDSAGVEYNGAVIGDLSITKNGTTSAMAAAATLVYIANGYYTLTGIAGNTNTLGRCSVTCNKASYQMPPVRFSVMTQAAYTNFTAGTAGSGAQVVTITVQDIASPFTVLANASVRMSEGANNYIAITNSSGIAVFALDPATYSVSITKGGYSFTPTTLVVPASATPHTYSMTALTSTTVSDPGELTGYIYAYNEFGVVVPDVVFTLKFVRAPDDSTGHRFDYTMRYATSAADGKAQFTGLFEGAKYKIRSGGGAWFEFIAHEVGITGVFTIEDIAA